jgi:Ca2+-binding EF-hand superfamily protein
MKQEFFAEEKSYLSKLNPEEREKRLLLLFRRMDLSGDGRLDVEEFQAALKSVFRKEDVSLEDAQKVVSFVDQNGDGSIDFEEFCMAIEKSEEIM